MMTVRATESQVSVLPRKVACRVATPPLSLARLPESATKHDARSPFHVCDLARVHSDSGMKFQASTVLKLSKHDYFP